MLQTLLCFLGVQWTSNGQTKEKRAIHCRKGKRNSAGELKDLDF